MTKILNVVLGTALSGALFFGAYEDAQANGPHSISLGVEGFAYRYSEPHLMKDNGSLYGINGEYAYNFSNNWFLGADARLAWGRADYKSYRTGRDKNVRQALFETRGLVGYTFKNSSVHKTLYTGIGYRFKSDHAGGRRTTTGHYGYDRESNYVYLPIGARLSGDFNQSWDWQVTGEFDLLLSGRQRSYVFAYGRSINHKQDSGWGMKYDLLAGYKFGSNKISFGPFLNYWNIKKSNVVHGTIEPHNTTVEAGLKAKWTF